RGDYQGSVLHRRYRGNPDATGEPRDCNGVSVLCALSALDGTPEHRLLAFTRARAKADTGRAGRARVQDAATRPAARPAPGTALRWPAAARRDWPRARAGP